MFKLKKFTKKDYIILAILVTIMVIALALVYEVYRKANDVIATSDALDEIVMSEAIIADGNIENENVIENFINHPNKDKDLVIHNIKKTGFDISFLSYVEEKSPEAEDEDDVVISKYVYKSGDVEKEYPTSKWMLSRKIEDDKVKFCFESKDFGNMKAYETICEYSVGSSNYKPKAEFTYLRTKDLGVKQVVNIGEYTNKDYGVFTFGGYVDVTVEKDMVYPLKDAFANKVITIDDVYDLLELDYKYGVCEKHMYSDGGSTEYVYKDHTVLKCNSLDGNKDLIFGMEGAILNKINDIPYSKK